MTIREFAERLGVAERTVSKWEALGAATHPYSAMQAALDSFLAACTNDERMRFVYARSTDDGPGQTPTALAATASAAAGEIKNVEKVRRGMDEVITEGYSWGGSVDDWELLVRQHGLATRDRPAPDLLLDLTTDAAELRRVLHRHHTKAHRQRLTKVAAQIAGLICLTLIKLDENAAARNWARTARLAADQAGDPATRSWVRAQQAYGLYYTGSLSEAIFVAADAQALGKASDGPGVALAAALEARAHAARSDVHATRKALGRAETALGRLQTDELIASAFGYNEAQLRFHEGSAYTHLRESAAAAVAHDRALVLYDAGDYLDRALIRLDQAACLEHAGDGRLAAAHAAKAVEHLQPAQRVGLVLTRAQKIYASFTPEQRRLPEAVTLGDLIREASTTDREAQNSGFD